MLILYFWNTNFVSQMVVILRILNQELTRAIAEYVLNLAVGYQEIVKV